MNSESYLNVLPRMKPLCLIIAILCVGCSKIRYVNPDKGPYWPDHNRWEKHADDLRPQDAVLIISIEDYVFLPDVEGGDKTAADWSRFFYSKFGLQPTLLQNHDATKENILKTLAELGEKKPARVWIVFVGHGAPDVEKNDGVLVGSDAQQTPESLRVRGVTREDLITPFANQNVVLILDACFSGRTPAGDALAENVQPVVPLTLKGIPANVTVLSAAETSQFAGRLPGTQRPAFSYLLLGALRGWGDQNGDGEITAGEALAFTKESLRFVPGRSQTPTLEGDEALVLSHGVEEAIDVQQLMRKPAKHETEKDVFRIDTGEGIIVQTINGWKTPEYKTQMELFSLRQKGTAIVVEKMKEKCREPDAAVSRCKERQIMAHMFHVLPTATTIGDHAGTYGSYWKPGLKETTIQQEVFVVRVGQETWRFQMSRNGTARITEEERVVFRRFIETAEFTP